MANNPQILLFLVLIFCCLTYFSCAYNQLIVGGGDGWVSNPSEHYNHWAQRLRFEVNDTLLFRYNQLSNSVLVVNKVDFDKCNPQNPIQRLNDGNSIFKFDRSGPFYFITSNQTNCNNGQKMFIVVMAVRNRLNPQPTAPSPANSSPPTTVPVGSPSSLSPSPATYGPAPSTDSSGSQVSSSPPPEGVNLLPHRSFAAPLMDNSFVLMPAISLALSVGFGSFIVSY